MWLFWRRTLQAEGKAKGTGFEVDVCFMCLSYRKEADASRTLLVRREMVGWK